MDFNIFNIVFNIIFMSTKVTKLLHFVEIKRIQKRIKIDKFFIEKNEFK